MKIDKRNGEVCYNDEAHLYWNEHDNSKYISVTTLIHQFTQPFDKEFWSAYKALEKLIPKDSWGIEKNHCFQQKDSMYLSWIYMIFPTKNLIKYKKEY